MLAKGEFVSQSTLRIWVFVGFLLFPVAISQIPLGSKLLASENSSWVSSNGDFAIGFFNHSDQPGQFSLGIRFNSDSIPVNDRKTVWVAGANVMVNGQSYFQLMQTGELVLFDPSKGCIVWNSNTSNLSIASAALQDNGNFVLMTSDKEIVWQSFDTPSDTLLPGQKFSLRQTLRAASKNSMSSYYTLILNVSGQLQLKWETAVRYWTSDGPSSLNSSAFITKEGALQILGSGLRPVWSAYAEDHNDSVDFRFLRLDVDGNLRLYSWVKASWSWRSVWQAVKNQCDVFATCSLCGICTYTASGSSVCRCPFTETTESTSKCLIPYQEKCSYGSTFIPYEHTSLYGIYPPNDTIITTSLPQCKSMCSNNPLCTAVTYTNDGTGQCRVKQTQYVTGQVFPSLRSVSFVKMCLDPMAVLPTVESPSLPVSLPKWSFEFCVSCQIGVASAIFAVFVLVQLGVGFYIYKRGGSIWKRSAGGANMNSNSKGLIMLSYAEIEELTGGFKQQIGPDVFRGILPNQQQVVIRSLKAAAIEERKFRSTVLKIGSVCHKNLLKLEGYCCELGQRFLVYEFAKNGSLDKYIKDSKMGGKKLNWGKRIEICLSVARVVSYLHSGCREFFSHGNLKCENVVLDQNLEPKLTDFGLDKLSDEPSCTAGTDVANFGKMVIMLVSGRLEAEDVCKWAYEEWHGGQSQNVVDGGVRDGKLDSGELERVLRIAFWCLQGDERMRPSMGEVVKVLEGTLPVDPPPPHFVCQRSSEEDSLELE